MTSRGMTPTTSLTDTFMIQLILHLFGDYVTQSDWMANNKTKRFVPAAAHAIVYSLPFILIFQPSYLAGLVILGTHLLIDRYRLARFVVWGKNVALSPVCPLFHFLNPRKLYTGEAKNLGEEMDRLKWANCSATGYPSETPAWLAVWLLIAADNTLHLAINYAALRWL